MYIKVSCKKVSGCIKSPLSSGVIASEAKQSINLQIDCFSRTSFAMTISDFLHGFIGHSAIGRIAFLGLLILANLSFTGAQTISVHDPVMIRHADRFYLFCTGVGISCWSSADMVNWKAEKPVFDRPPAWAVSAVKGFKGHIWAPDISYHHNRYYLYYSVSSFGKNTSCIGLATNPTLNPDDPAFKWTDHGKVIQSVPNRDNWNAIDPNLVVDENNTGWLNFGSFWGGIKMVRLNDHYTAIDTTQQWYTLAARERVYGTNDDNAGEGAIEAPFIIRKNDYYYLFVSFDYCCRGVNSNYKIMIGRSASVTGPYVDRNGKELAAGGGSLLVQGNAGWPGVGHNGICSFDQKDYMVFHGYDASDGGKPKLLVREIEWDATGWPVVKL
jgi:arabinan endo-1,5-alpha-L-arabinosidase